MAREQWLVVLVGTETLYRRRIQSSLEHAAGLYDKPGIGQPAMELLAQSRRGMEYGTFPAALSRQ